MKKKKTSAGKKFLYTFCIIVMAGCISASGILLYNVKPCEVCGNYICFDDHSVDISGETTVKAIVQKTNQKLTHLVTTETQPASYLDKVYFIGDSRSVALETVGISKDKIFAAVSLNHVSALESEVVELAVNKHVTIPDAVKIKAPEIAIVNFGINGIRFMEKEEFLTTYKNLLSLMIKNSPNTIFVIQSINPIGMATEVEPLYTNEYIDEMNEEIYDMAAEMGLFYLDTNNSMKNSYNDLIEEYNSGDGLHYSHAGYQAIVDAVLNHAIIKE